MVSYINNFVNTMPKEPKEKAKNEVNLKQTLEQLETIVRWFDDQEEADVEEGLKKVKEGAVLLKAAKARLKEVENEFEEVKKDLEEANGD